MRRSQQGESEIAAQGIKGRGEEGEEKRQHFDFSYETRDTRRLRQRKCQE
jgi:hypothetical protein